VCALSVRINSIPSCCTPLHSTPPNPTPLCCITIHIALVMLIFEFMIGRVELVWSGRRLNPFNRNNISRFNTSPSVLNVCYYLSWKRTNWKRTRTATVKKYFRSLLHIFHFSASDHPLTHSPSVKAMVRHRH
jgi:hypothetical protein